MKRPAGRAWQRRLAIALLAALCSACGSGQQEDLQAYIQEVLARRGGEVEPPPERPSAFAADLVAAHAATSAVPSAVNGAPLHAAAPLRSPFAPDATALPGDVPHPQERRDAEFLERFPLDELRMVGLLRFGAQTFALVQTHDGHVHRVAAGDRLGQNHGRVVDIRDAEIHLVETVVDAAGETWQRQAVLVLGD